MWVGGCHLCRAEVMAEGGSSLFSAKKWLFPDILYEVAEVAEVAEAKNTNSENGDVTSPEVA